MTDLIVLSTLLGGPKHGYQLKHEAGIITGQGVLHNNLVYPLLRRFMQNKWVERRTVPGERGQDRQQYSLTPLGRNELTIRLSSFTDQEARSSEEFLVRVGLFWLLEPGARSRILESRAKYLQARTQTLAAIDKKFLLNPYAAEVISHYRAITGAELRWIARLRKIGTRKGGHS